MKILLAEPDPGPRTLILTERGHTVSGFGDITQALASFLKSPHDALVVYLPDSPGDALKLVRAIRKQSSGGSVRIVASGVPFLEIPRFEAAGVDQFLQSPIDDAELVKAVEGTPAKQTATLRDEEPLNEKSAMQLVDGDEELFLEIVGMFFNDADLYRNKLMTSFESGNVADVEKYAHTLKGAASNICAGPLKEASARIEQAARQGNLALVKEKVPDFEAEYERLKVHLARYIK